MSRTLLIVIAIALLLCCGCRYQHRFHSGDLVQMKVDGTRGMVVGVFSYHDGVQVRFAADRQVTNTPLLGGSRPIRQEPYSLVVVHDFELEPAKE